MLPLDEILKYLDGWRAKKPAEIGNDSMTLLRDLAIGEGFREPLAA